MATFVRLCGKALAINMDLVATTEWADEAAGTLAVTFHDGRTRILSGLEAKRVVAWLGDHSSLPAVQRVAE